MRFQGDEKLGKYKYLSPRRIISVEDEDLQVDNSQF
jgi:hypothetical protein